MPTAVLTPFSRGAARSGAGRLWRKRLLPVGEIDYQGRKLVFSRDYNDGLAAAYASRAYDQVPFQLAKDKNEHTNDPERFRGEVVSVTSEPDGLWITLAPTSDGERSILTNPNLGVSARIVEDYSRSDGRYFPAAIQHVLGTLDPRIPGLGSWKAIEAANTDEAVIDLTGLTFTGEKEADMPELSEEKRAKLSRLLDLPEDQLAKLLGAPEPATAPQPQPEPQQPQAGDDGELSDEELDELIAAAMAEEESEGEGAPEPATAGAGAALSSDETTMALELAHAEAAENARQLSVIQGELDAQRYEAEKRKIVETSHIPPYVVDLARPLLEGAGHTVELSNGNRADAGQILRRVFSEIGKTVQMLDLSAELGHAMDAPGDGADNERDELVSRARKQMGLI